MFLRLCSWPLFGAYVTVTVTAVPPPPPWCTSQAPPSRRCCKSNFPYNILIHTITFSFRYPRNCNSVGQPCASITDSLCVLVYVPQMVRRSIRKWVEIVISYRDYPSYLVPVFFLCSLEFLCNIPSSKSSVVNILNMAFHSSPRFQIFHIFCTYHINKGYFKCYIKKKYRVDIALEKNW